VETSLHSIYVGGVAKNSIMDVDSLTDLLHRGYTITVAKNEIGHELVNSMKIPKSKITIVDTNDISEIVAFVKSGEIDIALLDSLSIKNYFNRTDKADRKTIKQILKKRPVTVCLLGTMILKNQHKFSDWIDKEFREVIGSDEIARFEKSCLDGYKGIISKV
jgi:ABC-type amino acid transport substrate-binding protein